MKKDKVAKSVKKKNKLSIKSDKIKKISVVGVIVAVIVARWGYFYYAVHDSSPYVESGKVETVAEVLSNTNLEQEVAIEPEQEVSLNTEPVPQVTSFEDYEEYSSQIPYWLDSAKIQLVEIGLPKQIQLDELDEEDTSNAVALVDKVVVVPKPVPKVEKPVKPRVLKQAAKKIAAKKLAGHYTIQLLASHKKADVSRLKHDRAAFAHAKIRSFTNDKGSWYVLTLGDYQNRDQAQKKIKQLSPELAKYNPWVRPVAGLKSTG